ncbi:MAG TPA: hypothetical protein VGO93_08200, partial [Candidatus Xenobia bacterium]
MLENRYRHSAARWPTPWRSWNGSWGSWATEVELGKVPDKRPLTTPGRKSGAAASAALQHTVLPKGQPLRAESGRTYRIVQKLGEGAMGAVYEALGPEPCAIKVLFAPVSDADQYHRFQREIAICAELRHPGIVHVVDWGVHRSTIPF